MFRFYKLSWTSLVRQKLSNVKRTDKRLAWMDFVVSQLKVMFTNFLLFKDDIDYLNNYDSRIIWLEKRLNDKWDMFNRGIFIDNLADLDRSYIFNKIEQRPTTYYYSKWQQFYSFQVDDTCVEDYRVWKCLVPGTNHRPSTTVGFWQYVKPAPILRNKFEYDLLNDFIVYVPTGVVFDEFEMKATINLYKYASLKYQIIIY